MGHYKKLITYGITMVVLLLNRHAGVDLVGQEQLIIDAAIAIVGAFGVERFANTPKKEKTE